MNNLPYLPQTVRIRRHNAVLVVVLLLAIFSGYFLLFANKVFAATYSNPALLDSRLIDARNTASAQDGDCKNSLNYDHGLGPAVTDRAQINGVAPYSPADYRYLDWISPSGNGSTNSIPVAWSSSGNYSVNLQFNAETFLCFPMVAGCSATCDNWGQVITPTNYTDDQPPNPVPGTDRIYGPALTNEIIYVNPAGVSASSGSLTPLPDDIFTPRDNNSRFWFNDPSLAQFKWSGSLSPGVNTISVNVPSQWIGVYYGTGAWGMGGATITCASGAGVKTLVNTGNPGTMNYSGCNTNNVNIAFQVVVSPPPQVTIQGRVWDMETNVGAPGVQVVDCQGHTMTTDGNGFFQENIDQDSWFCLRVVNGNVYGDQVFDRPWAISGGGVDDYNSDCPARTTSPWIPNPGYCPETTYEWQQAGGGHFAAHGVYNRQDGTGYDFGFNRPPIGNLDVGTCTQVAGWSFDWDATSTSDTVVITYTGNFGTTTQTVAANVSRPDVNAAFGISGNHGFNVVPPAVVVDSTAAVTVSVAAEDTTTSMQFGIGGSPKTTAVCNHPVGSISISQVCGPTGGTSSGIEVQAQDPDWPTPPNAPVPGWITWSIPGGNPSSGSGSTSPTFIPIDQLASQTATIVINDLNQLGQVVSPSPYTVTRTFTTSPCYTMACSTSSPDHIVAGDPTPIPVSVSMKLNPVGAAPPNPLTLASIGVYSTMQGSLNGPGIYTSPITPVPPGSQNNTLTLNGTVQASPQNGTATLSWSFTDTTTGATTPCGSSVSSEYAPYFQVNGGDVEAGSTFNASNGNCTDPSGTDGIVAYNQNTAPAYSGAGTQLAAQALAQIVGFVTNQTTTTTLPSNLALSNTSANVNLGSDQYGANYGYATCPTTMSPPVTQSAASTAGSFDLASQPTGGTFTFNNSLFTLSSSLQVPVGVHYTIYVYGNIDINSSIVYNQLGWMNPSTIPSVTVIAVGGNIYVDPAATELDGLYEAQPVSGTGGAVYTCSDTSGRYVSGGPCDTQLNVYGSFIAKKLEPQRGYGSIYSVLTTAQAPAETIWYDPELWLNSQSPNNTTYDSIASLPPIL